MSHPLEPPEPGTPRLTGISTHLSALSQPHRLLDRYGKAIRQYLGVILGEDDAEEVSREIAVKVMRGSFACWAPGKGRFRDYLIRAVQNAAVDWLRKRPGGRQNREILCPDLTGVAGREGPGEADVWLRFYRGAVWSAALKALKEYQAAHPGNVFHTLVELLGREAEGDFTSVSYPRLAELLTRATGRRPPFTADNARQQAHRARRKLAELLLEEVRQTLDAPGEEVADELRLLGLKAYVEAVLPAREGQLP